MGSMINFGLSEETHRCQSPLDVPEVINFENHFSTFDFLSHRFRSWGPSIRRCFSLARSFNCKTVVFEKIAPAGMIDEENSRLRSMACHSDEILYRVSFWLERFDTADDISQRDDKDLVGYLIVKHDYGIVNGIPKDKFYVFEAVFVKYCHEHNCITRPTTYSVVIGPKGFHIVGVLYCQQNGITKVCAHVALRTLLSRCVQTGDVNYETIHSYALAAMQKDSRVYYPWRGLSSECIQDVLDAFGMTYNAYDYDQVERQDPTRAIDRYRHPYQAYLYSGVESGIGALMGFKVVNRDGSLRGKHIIPFYGHTFNKDTWVSDADTAYFTVTQEFRYMRSENWASSFIGHDDNFGPNFCVPRLYMRPEHVDYVVAIQEPGVILRSQDAEVAALSIISECVAKYGDSNNPWVRRLALSLPHAGDPNQRFDAVLRAVELTKDEYVSHLKNSKDWQGNSGDDAILDVLSARVIPARLIVVEVSMAQLFPANKDKLAEVVFDGAKPLKRSETYVGGYEFVLTRMPGRYLTLLPVAKNSAKLAVATANSKFVTHIPLFHRDYPEVAISRQM